MTVGRLDYPQENLTPARPLLMTTHLETADGHRIAQMRLGACAKEPHTVAFIESLSPGECLWDVGASVGPYTLIAAARGLAVVAFEPSVISCAEMVQNLAMNNLLESVVVANYGLGDQDAMIWLHYSSLLPGAADHKMTGSSKKVSLHAQIVPILTAMTALQIFGLQVPNAIKIDVDGFELEVLQGMEPLLVGAGQLRALMIELNIMNDNAKIVWLEERGWHMDEQYEPRGHIYYGLFHRVPVAHTNGTTSTAGLTTVTLASHG